MLPTAEMYMLSSCVAMLPACKQWQLFRPLIALDIALILLGLQSHACKLTARSDAAETCGWCLAGWKLAVSTQRVPGMETST